MNDLWRDMAAWWAGGDLLMPLMLAVAFVLYALLAERSVVLFGPNARRARRRDELERLLAHDHASGGGVHWRAWAGRYVAAAEALELTRGFALARALTAALPLLGLLGTVTGMVDTFGDLALGGRAGAARQASAGISLALTATQYGMCLAIPALLWEWVLARRVERLVEHRETVAAALRADPALEPRP